MNKKEIIERAIDNSVNKLTSYKYSSKMDLADDNFDEIKRGVFDSYKNQDSGLQKFIEYQTAF